MRQPSAGWQTITPVAWYGAHSRLQQSPHPLHTVPSTPALQFVAPTSGCVHRPRPPEPGLQMPPQQSVSCAHASPSWMQNEPLPQWPLVSQNFEQQSPAAVHALPSVLQAALSAAQLPPVHDPLQHWPSLEHDWPSPVHC
jgi:hypothetical protein